MALVDLDSALDNALLWVLFDGRLRDKSYIYTALSDPTNQHRRGPVPEPDVVEASLRRLVQCHLIERGYGRTDDVTVTIYNITAQGLAALKE